MCKLQDATSQLQRGTDSLYRENPFWIPVRGPEEQVEQLNNNENPRHEIKQKN